MSATDPTAYFAHLRHEYGRASLDVAEVATDPVVQFEVWFNQALEAQIREPHAMNLATADAEGRPASRMVLLKEYDHRGFTFATNYLSRKGRNVSENPRAALCFYWSELERQVRIEGLIQPVSEHESDAYFNSRPPDARIGAWASPQSQVLRDRGELEQRYRDYHDQYGHSEAIPRPPHWGGYRLRPVLFEFWQGRESRLHDRVLYELADDGSWTRARLAP